MQLLRRFTTTPGFGLLYSVFALLTVIPTVMIAAAGMRWTSHSIGLEVRIAEPATLPHEDPLRVAVRKSPYHGSPRPTLYVNSKPVPWEDVAGLLRVELSRRAERVVYVESDEDLPFADVAMAIDAVQGAWRGATVVLLTPELKKNIEADKH